MPRFWERLLCQHVPKASKRKIILASTNIADSAAHLFQNFGNSPFSNMGIWSARFLQRVQPSLVSRRSMCSKAGTQIRCRLNLPPLPSLVIRRLDSKPFCYNRQPFTSLASDQVVPCIAEMHLNLPSFREPFMITLHLPDLLQKHCIAPVHIKQPT